MRILPALAFAILLNITAALHAQTSEAPQDYVILSINGEEIKRSEVEEIWVSLFPEGEAPDFNAFDEKIRLNVLRGVVSEHLIREKAMQSDLANSPEVQEKLAQLKEKLVTQAFLEQKASEQISEEEIRQAYEQKISGMRGAKEIKASHILVETEDHAKEIVEKLRSGKEFSAVAKERSLDKASARQGGSLGWFTKERMVPEFSETAFALEQGEISEPVKTDFGWHIIKLKEKRQVQVPSFEEMKPKIRKELKAKALKSYVASLVDSASISYFGPQGERKEFTKTPDSTAE
jgi:peptidyl-prolyl cis-trans isomerase C